MEQNFHADQGYQGYQRQNFYAVQGFSQPQNSYVVQGFPQYQTIPPVQPVIAPPPDYLTQSILAMLCCCWPLGLAAVLKSIKCREAIARGDMEAAKEHSKSAGCLVSLSVGCGIVLVVIIVIYVVLRFVAQRE